MTLLELLVVVSVVAALAGMGWSAYRGVREAELDTLAEAKLRQTAEALRRFKADLGHWPGQGPLALAPSTNAETATGTPRQVTCSDTSAGLWLRSTLPSLNVPVGVTDVAAWRADWAAHPANLWQLVVQPVLCSNHPLGRLQDWSPAVDRGWRGPYLDPDQLGYVEVGNGLRPDGSGSALSAPVQSDLRGLPLGRWMAPLNASGAECADTDTGACAWRWRIHSTQWPGYDKHQHTRATHPRPLLYFGPASGQPRLVWVGADGRFGGFSADVTRACTPNTADPAGEDDRVLCLD